jgi:preprotein translocase subunit SecE
MSKLTDSINRLRTFVGEVSAELKKSAWPTRSELFDSTIVVIISVALLGGFVAVCDVILRQLVRWILG